MASEITGLGHPALQPAQARAVASTGLDVQRQPGERPAAGDTVTLTDSARLMQRLEAAVANAPAVDARRIDHIRQQILDGNYQVDPQKLAAQVVKFEQDLMPPVQEPMRDVQFTRTEDGFSVDVTTTTARGTRERSVDISVDPETKTVTRDITITGANGEQISRHGTLTVTESGYTTNVTFTGRNDESISRMTEVTVDGENDTLTKVVNLDGREHSFTRTTTVTRLESGEIVRETKVDPSDNNLA